MFATSFTPGSKTVYNWRSSPPRTLYSDHFESKLRAIASTALPSSYTYSEIKTMDSSPYFLSDAYAVPSLDLGFRETTSTSRPPQSRATWTTRRTLI